MKTTILTLSTCAVLAASADAQDIKARTHKQPLGDGSLRELHTRDVRGLIDGLLDARAVPADERAAAALRLNRELARVIREFVHPAFTTDEEIQSIGRSHLVAVAGPEQHAWVDRFLEHQKAEAGHMVQLEVRILQLDAKSHAGLEIGNEKRTLDKEEMTKLVAAINARKGANWLDAPKLLSFGLQEFHVSVTNQMAYVKDFEVQIHDGKFIADPVVDVLNPGTAIRGSAIELDDGRLGLLGHVDVTEVDHPIPVKKIEVIPGNPKVEIQTPSVHRVDAETVQALPAGATALFPIPPSRGRHVVVFMTPHRVVLGGGRGK